MQPSGLLARNAIARHDAWEKKKDRYFDHEEVERIFGIFSIFRHTSGDYGGKPFTLLPWQAWVIAQIFGWHYTETKKRVIRKAYVEVAKKNGKTELAAAIGLIMAFFDGEYGAEVYAAANKLEQAKICWGSAAAMARFLKRDSESFDKMIDLHDSFNNSKIFSKAQNAKFIPIASDSKTLDGLRPNCAIIDEFHESTDDSVLRNLESGMVNRAQPLLFIITTAGFNINGACYQYRKVITDILSGKTKDDSSFGMIFTLDEGDDWKNPEVFVKANPSIGITPTREAMTINLQRALNEGQSSEVNFKTKNLNFWVRQSKTWLPDELWTARQKPLPITAFYGRDCFSAMDLAATRDITCFGHLFPPLEEDGDFYFFCRYFIPRENAELRAKRDRVPYLDWIAENKLFATDGNILDEETVIGAILDDMRNYRPQKMYYDPWQSAFIASRLASENAPMEPIRQTVTNFNEPVTWIEKSISRGILQHNNDEILRWMCGNVNIRINHTGLKMPDKELSREKIDGIIVLAMCVAGYLNSINGNDSSVYNSERFDGFLKM